MKQESKRLNILKHFSKWFNLKKEHTSDNIISLSPNNKLFDEHIDTNSDYYEYKKDLGSALSNENIQNIAITGNYGVGKSSIIRSYETQDKKRGKGYFYISLMDFKYNNILNKASNQTEEKFQQEFEKYLLCQILSKADASSLPHSMFKLIPTKGKLITKIITVFLTLLFLCVSALILHEQINIPDKFITVIYCVCAILSILPVVSLFNFICNSITSAKLSAKYGNIKLETESKESENSYIDDHIFEIIYSLETMAKDIGYIVVLEDIDRLGKNICIDIFSKLRRINLLINDRKKLKNHKLRFIYAFNDSVFELAKNTKFFDYVMSVTPRLNYDTSGRYFKKLMLATYLGDDEISTTITDILNGYDDEFWDLTGYVIHDYRTLNHIRNEFHLFVNVMKNRAQTPTEKWLPFIIYKNLLADDYCNAFDQQGVLELDKEERTKRLEQLCCSKGQYYIKLITNLFDYICDNLKLQKADFQSFTGLPQEVVKIREEVIRNSELENILNGNFEFDNTIIGDYFYNLCVMVTGGAGLIGSELCRKLAEYGVSQLVIVDINENAAYDIQQELISKYGNRLNINIEIMSVLDTDMLDKVFEKYKPQIVFHSAARKHVPLMERNPEEAVRTNIFGTYTTVRLSERHGVRKFVLISTDKACYPTSVMGATKCFAEMLTLGHDCDTKFSFIRFGNVIGSNGSVVPLFKKQIEYGGPITITHPNIIRYMMTISEAALMILSSAAIDNSNCGFVLDMGKPVKIKDLAEYLIRLSGLIPGKDIEIVYTGLRPGEKLYEELLIYEEELKSTKVPKIYELSPKDMPKELIENGYKRLVDAVAKKYTAQEYKTLLNEIVPNCHININ